ncbi:MAG: NADH-quinone oxidoreductase subunit J [Acidimicrobiales bacterium]
MTAAALGTLLAATARPTIPDVGVFAVAAAIIIAGAIGVVVARNPVHSALMLVMTLFGVAVMFVLQQASFLAAVQVIVYAGAIVVLFLFVIMFLGVDREEDVAAEPLRGQRPLAVGLVVLGTTGLLLLGQVSKWTTGQPGVAGSDAGAPNVNLIGKSLYTTYLFPFEATSALLIIAVVGAVVLARRPPASTAQGADADAFGDIVVDGGTAGGDPAGSGAAVVSDTATPEVSPAHDDGGDVAVQPGPGGAEVDA